MYTCIHDCKCYTYLYTCTHAYNSTCSRIRLHTCLFTYESFRQHSGCFRLRMNLMGGSDHGGPCRTVAVTRHRRLPSARTLTHVTGLIWVACQSRARFGQFRVRSATFVLIPAESGFRPMFGLSVNIVRLQLWVDVASLRQGSTTFGLGSINHCSVRPSFGMSRPNRGRDRPNLGRVRPREGWP